MNSATDEARKAADRLDLGRDRDDQADAESSTSDETETDSESSTSDESKSGISRLFRTDQPLDLDNSADFWDPRGKGGINRVGAAIQQMGGWEFVMPVVWLVIGLFEILFLAIAEQGLIPSSDDDETDQDDDQDAPDQDTRPPERRDHAAPQEGQR